MAFLDFFRKPKAPVAPAPEPVRTWALTLVLERRFGETRLMNGVREIWIPEARRAEIDAMETGSGVRADCAFVEAKMQLIAIREVTAPGELLTEVLLGHLERALGQWNFEEAGRLREVLLGRRSPDAPPAELERRFSTARCRQLQSEVSDTLLQIPPPDRLPIAIFAVESAVAASESEVPGIETALQLARSVQQTGAPTVEERAALLSLPTGLSSSLGRLVGYGQSPQARWPCRDAVAAAIDILWAAGEGAGFAQELAQEIQRRYAERRIEKYAPEAAKKIVRVCWSAKRADGTDILLVVLPDARLGLFQKMKSRWKFFEGPRDEVLATVPDEHFEAATSAAFKGMN